MLARRPRTRIAEILPRMAEILPRTQPRTLPKTPKERPTSQRSAAEVPAAPQRCGEKSFVLRHGADAGIVVQHVLQRDFRVRRGDAALRRKRPLEVVTLRRLVDAAGQDRRMLVRGVPEEGRRGRKRQEGDVV